MEILFKWADDLNQLETTKQWSGLKTATKYWVICIILFFYDWKLKWHVYLSLYFGELFVCNILSDQINYLLSAIYYINDLIFDVQAFLRYCVKLT